MELGYPKEAFWDPRYSFYTFIIYQGNKYECVFFFSFEKKVKDNWKSSLSNFTPTNHILFSE